jgi:hypothetical protein
MFEIGDTVRVNGNGKLLVLALRPEPTRVAAPVSNNFSVSVI